ncbi:post-GPI attachment to proteins factor 2 [Pararge aegeria]|uniref:Jg23889 protein n=1 Tax=Pararge aegeria aegeria TaxID=348720 RepID=A0A8S4S6T1_9NEOP|nr:post-GPI attachment to proteins factor 2 [Pararge aegeria]CAH2247027.1 jg23889 [Pararge aegeria aegeria]
MYLPLHNGSERKYFVRVSIRKLGLFTVSLPLFAFITCVIITLYKDFENANNTHCKVPNVFPSISASIGNYEPQRSIWRVAIYSHAPFRFLIVFLRWKYYSSVISQNCAFIVKLAVFLNILENLSLIGLTHWTSSKNYPLHEACFKTFIGSSIFYMFFACMMLTKYRRRTTLTHLEIYSVKLKWRSFFVNVGSFTFAAYFFLRHNRLCEPYVYSMFGFSEYVVVVSNIIFHMTTVYDFKMQFIYLTRNGFTIE